MAIVDYIYDLGPWVRDAEMRCWVPPRGTIGSICFGSLPDCGLSVDVTDNRPRGFFARDPAAGSLGLDYLTLGRGDCREYKPDGNTRNSAAVLMGVAPEGETLVDWLADWLFRTGSFDGSDRWKIGTPTREGNKEIHLGGHSRIWTEKFTGAADKSWNRLRDLLRYDLDKHDKECKAEAAALKDAAKELRKQGKTTKADACDARAAKVENHAEKVFDAMCRKYKCLPSELSKEIRRGKAETTISESFGSSLSGWTNFNSSTWATSGGYLGQTTADGSAVVGCRCDTDLSASDHYAQAKIYAVAGADHGVCARWSSSAETYYSFRFTGQVLCYKTVTGSATMLFVGFGSWSSGSTIKIDSTGSTITATGFGSSAAGTDTAITSGVRAGVLSARRIDLDYKQKFDDFYATDGMAAAVSNPANRRFGGVPFTRPGNTRGVHIW